jgi:hypothetical protein
LSLYLANSPKILSIEERTILKEVLVNVSKICKLILSSGGTDQISKDFYLYSLILCCFVDFMRCIAPDRELEFDELQVKLI